MSELIYRPQHKTEQELKDDFVIRLVEFEKLMNSIKTDEPDKIPQHIILQGQRGMGKTTLMYRVLYQVQKDYEKKGVIPVIFSEEQYGVRMLFKLWEQVARYLEENEPKYAGIWYEMQDSQHRDDYEENCFELLKAKILKNKHRLILFIDNFGVMLNRFPKRDQQRFREILTTSPYIKIIGGSAVVLESFYRYDKPFFDFFKIEQLGALDSKEVQTLLLRLGEKYETDHIKEIVETQPGRIEAMRILTGGVPRTIVLLFNIFLDQDHGNSIDDLKKLLDAVTPLYKHRMDDLPAPQQEIVEKLALNWDGMSVSELVSSTRMQSKVISSQLGNLEKSGVVHSTRSTGKNKFYQLEERFFNIWYLMQHAPRSGRQKVLWLTRFLELWCGGKILEDTAKRFTQRVQKENLNPEYVQAMTYAFSTAHGLSPEVRDGIIKVASEKLKSDENLPMISDEFWKQWEELLVKNEHTKLIRLIDRAGFSDAYEGWLKGYVFDEMGNPEKAELYYLRAVKEGYVDAMINLAVLYEQSFQDFKQAEKYYKMAVQDGQVDAMVNLATLYDEILKDFKQAEKYYLMAMNEGNVDAMFGLGLCYDQSFKDYKKAEKTYLKAVEKGHVDAMFNLALLYEISFQDYRKSEKYYLMAVDQGHQDAISNLGLLYATSLEDIVRAEEYFLMAINEGIAEGAHNLINMVVSKNLDREQFEMDKWMNLVLQNEPNHKSKFLVVKYLIWADRPQEATLILEELLSKPLGDDEQANLFLNDVLAFAIAKGLKRYVFKLFQNEEYNLKDRLKVVYYALMKLMQNEYPNEIRRMGKELEEPVNAMVNYIQFLEEEYE